MTAPTRMVLVGVYDAPERDPRGRVISVAYTGYAPGWSRRVLVTTPPPRGGCRSTRSALDVLAFDHAEIVRTALTRAGELA